MVIVDQIYGAVTVDEPVIVDLLATRGMQRLRGVLQHGISGLLGLTSETTRYQHSVGVMLLLRRLGAPLEEQIAGLLHDISHTAFSHVIDYVFDQHDGQSYHDEMKVVHVAETDIPAVLTRYGYDWVALLDEGAYPLLEQPAPALCADRLDYFLRDTFDMGLTNRAAVERVLAALTVQDGKMVLRDVDVARWVAETYMEADDFSWANFREVGLYEVTARAIKVALARGLVTQADLWSTDAAFWSRLVGLPDAELQTALRLVSLETQFERDDVTPTFWVSTKIRTLDPPVVLADGSVQVLSALDAHYAAMRAAYRARKAGPWPMRVIAPRTVVNARDVVVRQVEAPAAAD